MATLNPIPNPAVMIVQAGTFLIGLVIVTKTILEPYLQVRKHRLSQTQGKKEEAEFILSENQRKLREVQEKIQEAVVQAKDIQTAHKIQALKERDEILKQAEKHSLEIIAQTKNRIQEEIRIERQKIPAIVDSLVKVMFDQVVSQ